jgi:hypothetical protein
MPRSPSKIVIQELDEGYRATLIVQSTARQPREYPDKDAVLEYLWAMLTLVGDSYLVQYIYKGEAPPAEASPRPARRRT